MKDVTDGLPGDAGCSGSVIPATVRRSYCSPLGDVLHVKGARGTSGENADVVDLPAVAGALAALDAALAAHGAPDPERTAAWLESEAEPVGAVLAVVPRG